MTSPASQNGAGGGATPVRVLDAPASPQRPAAPGPRELRAQMVHRLQVGLFGLGAMLLLVGLANIIMDRAQEVEPADPVDAVTAVDAVPRKPASDPLADIGVVPAADPAARPEAEIEPAPLPPE